MIVKSLNAPKGEIIGKEFWFPIRVYWEDTDAEGIVYFANYLKFAERARTESLRYLGCCQSEELKNNNAGFVVKHCEVEYMSPAYLDDELQCSCSVVSIGGASVLLHQEIVRGQDVLAIVDIKAVYLSMDSKKPIKLPKEIVNKLEKIS